jgi:Xaa-Pro aminopeptidase
VNPIPEAWTEVRRIEMDIEAIQKALQTQGVDGWLFYDFANRDAIAYRILGLEDKHTSRRWYYLVPTRGEPQKLAHRVEPTKLDSLPGKKLMYSSWKEMRERLSEMLEGLGTVAMQYSPDCAIPYISVVDGGTVELIKGLGVDVVSSADLVQRFEGLVSPENYGTHVEAGKRIHQILEETWKTVAERISAGGKPTEFEIQQFIVEGFRREGLNWDETPPIVAVNEHAADPHFEPTAENARPILPGDKLLLDIWARMDQPDGVYYDITWCAHVGEGAIDPRYEEIFDVVVRARDAAVQLVGDRLGSSETLYGYEVDDVCRDVVVQAGFGPDFVHRTGHSIGREVHGNGVNIDNLETQDKRKVVPGALFSIEPGIYLMEEKMGVRTEIDVYVDENGTPVIFGPLQKELVRVV